MTRCACILVPFRDEPRQNRKAHLEHFLKTMPGLLDEASRSAGFTWKIVIGVQSNDGHKFSRGKVLNAAFKLAKAVCSADCLERVILHDVDLIPDAERVAQYFAPWPADADLLALNCTGEYEGCKDYIGGVCAIKPGAFEEADGFPLAFSGWGGEDDALRDRIGVQRIIALSSGNMLNLETDVPDMLVPGQVRAKHVPEFCMDKTERRDIRRRWKERDPGMYGLARQFFGAKKLDAGKALRHKDVHVFGLEVNAEHPLSWAMRISVTKHLPFYVHKDTGASTWELPVSNASVPFV
jgi:hypothetical protein